MSCSSWLRHLGVCVLAVIALGGIVVADVTTADPELGPLISGTSSYVERTFVWTDYAYDDRGPNTNAAAGGDAVYPPAAAPGNAADLIQLHVGLTGGGEVVLRALLNSLVDPNLPLLGVGFDTDDSTSTGGPTVPGGQWQTSEPLGLDSFVVLSSAGGELLRFTPQGDWSSAGSFPAHVDPVANLVEATVPLALLDPGGATWRAVGVLGLQVDSGSWLDGSGPIYDVAFVEAEALSTTWQDQVQADVLFGALAVSKAVAFVDFSKIDGGVTELAGPPSSGFATFLYHSRVDVGEGYSNNPVFRGGVYQPYVVRFPGDLGYSPPLILYLSGGGLTHLAGPHLFDTTQADSFDPPAVVAFPLGRDRSFFYGASQLDILHVIDDVRARLPLDPLRTVISGVSGGAQGSFIIGALFPDRFSGLFSMVSGSAAEAIELLNFLNVPIREQFANTDPLLGGAAGIVDPSVLSSLEVVDFYGWIVNFEGHNALPALSNCVYLELLTRPRVVDPPRVVYTVNPPTHPVRLAVRDVLTPEKTAGIDVLKNDAVYWVSGLRSRSADPGTIDVSSLARADRERVGTETFGTGENITAPRDLCGPNPDVQTGHSWTERGRPIEAGPPQPISNGMALSVTGLEAAAVDLPRMQLLTGAPLSIESTGDGPFTLGLTGPWQGREFRVLKDGTPLVTLEPLQGVLTLSDNFGGDHLYEILPDNCPFVVNPGQEDDGGIGTTTPDGIGNACQCGDVTGEGLVSGQDGIFITRKGLGYDDPMFAVPDNCDVTGNGVCNGQDGFFVTRAGLGFLDPLHVAPRGQNCPNANPALPE